MSRPTIRLLLFDAFDTLLHPRLPPHVQYAEEAQRILLPRLSSSSNIQSLQEQLSSTSVQAAFKTAFKSVWSSHPLYGARTAIETETEHIGSRTGPDAWWALVIARTFNPVIQSYGADQRGNVLEELQAALLNRFASDRAYTLFPDVPLALTALRSAFPELALGVASNSDTRILGAMHDLGVDQWLNIEPYADHPPTDKLYPPAILSYNVGAEKPSRGFFDACCNATSYKPGEILYIGDHLQEDFRGARQAGLHSLWLRRSNEWVTQGPHNDMTEEELAAKGLDQVERAHVVQSLEDVPAWLRAHANV